MIWRIGAAAALAIVATMAVFAMSGLEDFSLEGRKTSDLTFAANGDRLSGSVVLPEGEGPFPFVILVHGDGAATRFLDGAMLPFVNALLDAGFGVFAWDKPGTGDSDGDWLAQSMSDRAAEAVAAYNAVAALPDAQASAVGFIGFSQAGWVAPQAAGAVDPAFTVIIGAAVNWRDQAAYFTQQRLMAEGVSEEDAVKISLSQQVVEDAALLRQAPDPAAFPDMDKRRLSFVHRNYLSDSAEALGQIRGPLLALWGARDRNTDPSRNLARFQHALPQMTAATFAIIPSATHSLLDAALFDYQTPGEWPWRAQGAYLLLGRDAYADGAIDFVAAWMTDILAIRRADTVVDLRP